MIFVCFYESDAALKKNNNQNYKSLVKLNQNASLIGHHFHDARRPMGAEGGHQRRAQEAKDGSFFSPAFEEAVPKLLST